MTIVVDASVAAKWLIPKTDRPRAEGLLRAARENRLSMLAPGILPAEIGNFLWKAVYRARLQPAEARAQYGRFWRACPALVREYVLAGPALALALRSDINVRFMTACTWLSRWVRPAIL